MAIPFRGPAVDGVQETCSTPCEFRQTLDACGAEQSLHRIAGAPRPDLSHNVHSPRTIAKFQFSKTRRMSYLRNWFPLQTVTHPPSSDDQTRKRIPGSFIDDDDDGSQTATVNDDDSPPAFPAMDSAQRAATSTSPEVATIPIILDDGLLMPPPPIPALASRVPGVSRSNLRPTSSSLLAPLATTQKPAKPSKKVALAPGFGPLDWANLKSSGEDLRVRLEYLVALALKFTDHLSRASIRYCVSPRLFSSCTIRRRMHGLALTAKYTT